MDFIITHYDGDGYASGFILKKHLEAQGREVAVGIAEFLSFGVSSGLGNIVADRVVSPGEVERVFLLDLGTDPVSIKNIYDWLGDNEKEVIVMDHHDNKVMESEDKYMEIMEKYPNLKIINDPRACTTALVYRYVYGENPRLFGDEAYRKIVLAGITADMHTPENSDKYPLSASIYEDLASKTPIPTIHFPGNKSLPEHIYLATILNTIRRIFVVYRGQMEHAGMMFLEEYVGNRIIPMWRNVVEKAYWTMRAPAMVGVLEAYRHWLEYRSRIMETDEITVYRVTYPGLMVAVIDSEYDIGGYYASIWMKKYRESYDVGKKARKYMDMVGMVVDNVMDKLRDLVVGVALVYNVRLGTVSIRGHIPFEYISEFAKKYFGGGGHRIGAGAGVFSGTGEEFIRYVDRVVRPHIAMRFETAIKNFGKYLEWISTLERSYSDEEVEVMYNEQEA